MPAKEFVMLFVFVVRVYECQDYKAHPCIRKCDGVSRVCRYDFVAQYFSTLEPECLNCQQGNNSDCLKPRCIPADGSKRLVYTVNEMMPGPTIEVCRHDRIVVRLRNLLNPETTSIHWHGMHQRGTPFMDGVPGITQCPVMPYSNFTYDFEAGEGGTHFWHSHSGYQRSNGFFGPLIVHRQTEHHEKLYDEDVHHIVLTEWSSKMDNENVGKFMRTFHYFEDRVNSLLVNGLGPTYNNKIPGMRFNVTKGLRYRFRVINAANQVCPILVSIDGHRLTLISSDGNDFEPISVDSFNILNGERYDFVLNANQTVDEYRIRFNGLLTCNASTYAVVHYDSAPIKSFTVAPVEPKGIRLQCINDNPNVTCVKFEDLRSIDDSFNVKEPYRTYMMRFNIDKKHGGEKSHLYFPYVNGIAFEMPTAPLLLNYEQQTCNETHTPCNGRFCSCTHAITMPANKSIEMIFVDYEGMYLMMHPMHLHGNSFRLVASEKIGSNFSETEFEELRRSGRIRYNLDRPVLKDTVTVPPGGYTVIRFINDNPGVWFVHCHVDFHTEIGMSFAIRTAGEVSVPKNFPRCLNY